MSHQPFRLVPSLARILHTTVLQRIREVRRSFTASEVDGMASYALLDTVPHLEMCEALSTSAASVFQRGEAVTTVDDLLFPLRMQRRAMHNIQRCPNTTPDLEAAKAAAERALVTDLLRLSAEDVPGRDMSQLWSCVIQHSQWDGVEALLRHFPVQETVSMQDDHEFNEMVTWMCMCSAASSTSDGPPVPHAKRFLTEVLNLEEVVRRCRNALAQSLPAYRAARADVRTEQRETLDREVNAQLCVMLAATLRKQCGLTSPEFLPSEAEWAEWTRNTVAGLPAATAGAAASSSTSSPASVSAGNPSYGSWLRRLLITHDPAIPAYVRAGFVATRVSELQRLCRHRDHTSVGMFYFRLLPEEERNTTEFSVRSLVRDYHRRVMESVFWTIGPSPTGKSASNSSAPTASDTTGKRGKWTASSLDALDDKAASSAAPTAASRSTDTGDTENRRPATPTAVSFFLPPDAALAMLVGEISVMEPDEFLVAAHLPAIAVMLRSVLDHVTKHMGRDNASAPRPPSPSLWRAWDPVQSGYLAVVLSGLLRDQASVDTHPELRELVSEGLRVLRRLLHPRVLEERGSAADLTALLSFGLEAVVAVGGAVFEAQLRAMTLENVMKGFSRQGLGQIAARAAQRIDKESAGDQQRTREFIAQVEAAQLKLPLRKWQ